ncbi:MAG: hypothetical protein H7339_05720 [Arcicella sp.]|nr:hypothetical protein [Arcicella sp.]
MKKIYLLLLVTLFAGLGLTSCKDTKQISDLQDQARRLENQLQKERQENAELSSYRFSMESQFKRKNEDYVKCQEDGKDNFESLSKKYGELGSDYDKLQSAYKSLNEANDASKQMSARVIVDLEERIKQIKNSEVLEVKSTPKPSNPRIKRKKRRR